jgi:adenylate kinase
MLKKLLSALYFWRSKQQPAVPSAAQPKKEIMKNIILFGPPGSGKGTQAIELAKALNMYHISTGDLLRSEKAAGTELGLKAKEFMDAGELVPDEVVIGMIGNKLDELAGQVGGIIFDGFPRTRPQAEALDHLLHDKGTNIYKVLALDVSEEEIVARILNRGKTSGRADDTSEETIRTRFNVYLDQTAPLADYYKATDKFHTVPGEGSIEDIFEMLKQQIEN